MNTDHKTSRIVPCPQCGRSTRFDPANAFRPFCSERCKLIDLGEWAAETYRVPDRSSIDELASENDPEQN